MVNSDIKITLEVKDSWYLPDMDLHSLVSDIEDAVIIAHSVDTGDSIVRPSINISYRRVLDD